DHVGHALPGQLAVEVGAGLLTVTATTAAGRGRYAVVDVGRGDGLRLAAQAVPGLIEPFLSQEEQ
ncbi:hypothetical protein ACWEPC_56705, partial [Nonomuraea sp. NPDC004297]